MKNEGPIEIPFTLARGSIVDHGECDPILTNYFSRYNIDSDFHLAFDA